MINYYTKSEEPNIKKIWPKWLLQIILAIVLFLVITILASYKVFPSKGILTFNDFAFFHNWRTSLGEIATTLSSNYLGQEQSSILFNYAPKSVAINILNFFHFSDNQIAYILFFGLFFLSAVIYFFVFYKISRNYFFGLLAGIFVILNNLTIEHLAFGGAFYYFLGLISFAGLFSVFWYIYKNSIVSWKDIISIILIALLIIHPFYLVIYLSSLVIFFVFFITYSKNFKKNIIKFLIILLGIVSVHAYWLFPFIYGTIHHTAIEIYNNNIDNVFEGFLKVASYTNSVNFFQYFNLFSEHFHQTTFHYIFYSGILLLIISSLFFINNKKHKLFLFFILIVYFIFSNLALGPVSQISGGLWNWLWNNVPFFKFFRVFSRFLIIIIPIYLLYFAVFTREWKYRYKNMIFAGLILIILWLNIGILTGDLKGNILATQIPKEYQKINELFKNDTGNIIAFPTAGYESYWWGMNTNRTIMTQDYYLKDYLFSMPIIYNRGALNLDKQNNIFEDTLKFGDFNEKNLDSNLLNMNISYILIQKDIIDVENGKKIDYELFDKYFSANHKYILVENNQYFNLYRYNANSGKSVKIDGDIIFQKINSTEYNINLKNLFNIKDLILLQRYNENWKIYLHKESNSNLDDKSMIKELLYPFQKVLLDNNHKVAYDYANKWQIDAKYIKDNFSPDYYKINKDGTIDIELTLFFKPQSYFYWGILISVLSILILIISLLVLITKTIKERDKSNYMHSDWHS